MSISVRLVTDSDMPELSCWFEGKKWRHPASGNVLPESGFVAVEGDKLLAVSWLYVTNSGVAIIDWMASHPTSGSRGLFAVKKLVDHIEDVTSGKVDSLLYLSVSDKLSKFLKTRCGFDLKGKATICTKGI